MERLFLFFVLYFIPLFSFSQSKDWKINTLKSFAIPTSKDSLHHYNMSDGFVVYLDSMGQVMYKFEDCYTSFEFLPFDIKPQGIEELYFDRHRYVYKVSDGYLVGFSAGEWGGGLYWFSNNGEKWYKIDNDPVNGFIKAGNDLFVLEHESSYNTLSGSLLKLKLNNGKWVSKNVVTIPAIIYCAQGYDGQIIAVTTENIIKIDKNQQMSTVVEKSFWQILYPNSLVIKDDFLFVGMNGGVFKFDLKTGKKEWLQQTP